MIIEKPTGIIEKAVEIVKIIEVEKPVIERKIDEIEKLVYIDKIVEVEKAVKVEVHHDRIH